MYNGSGMTTKMKYLKNKSFLLQCIFNPQANCRGENIHSIQMHIRARLAIVFKVHSVFWLDATLVDGNHLEQYIET